MTLNFRKKNFKESEQVTQSIPEIKMGEGKSREEVEKTVQCFLDVV